MLYCEGSKDKLSLVFIIWSCPDSLCEAAVLYLKCHLSALYGQMPAHGLNYFNTLGHTDTDIVFSLALSPVYKEDAEANSPLCFCLLSAAAPGGELKRPRHLLTVPGRARMAASAQMTELAAWTSPVLHKKSTRPILLSVPSSLVFPFLSLGSDAAT